MSDSSALMPCPVCGGVLRFQRWSFLAGEGMTPPSVDCDRRCRAVTLPNVYESLRLEAWRAQCEAALVDLREAKRAASRDKRDG